MIGACSSPSGKFTKEIENVSQLMNEMQYEEAMAILGDLEEKVVPGDRYEIGRMMLVEELRSEAQYMVNHIEELEERYKEAMALYEGANAEDPIDLELYQEAMNTLQQTIDRFNEMTHLEMYQTLTDAKDEMVSVIEEKANTLDQAIEEGLSNEDFTTAEEKFSELKTLNNYFSNYVTSDNVEAHREKIDQERERFVFVPEKAVKWEETLHEQKKGSISIQGVREIDEEIEIILSFTGHYQKLSDEIQLKPRMIHINGDSLSGYHHETRMLPEETLLHYRFSTYDPIALDDIVRIDFDLPFISEEAIQVVADHLDEAEAYQIPGVKSIQATHEPDWTIETEDFTVAIESINISNYNIELKGYIKPNKDLMINELSDVYLPFSGERETLGRGVFGSVSKKELYANTELEFNHSYHFNHPITEHHDVMNLLLFEQQAVVDLKNGELLDREKPTAVMDLYNTSSSTVRGFDQSRQEELMTQDGEVASTDSIMFTRSRADNKYYLFGEFDTFKTTIHTHKNYGGKGYGSTELIFFSVQGDEQEEIYKTTVKENHKPKEIEIDVSNVDVLLIEIYQERGSDGRQKVILEDPRVE